MVNKGSRSKMSIDYTWIYIMIHGRLYLHKYLFYILCVVRFCDPVQNRRLKICWDGLHIRRESELCRLHESHLKFRRCQHLQASPTETAVTRDLLPAFARQFLGSEKRSPTNLPNFEARGPLIAGFYGKWKGWMVGMGRFWMMMLTFRVYKCSNLPDSQEGAATVLPFLPFFQTFCCRWDLLPTCGWEACRFADGSWGPKRSKAGKEGKPETSAPVLLLNTGFDQILP